MSSKVSFFPVFFSLLIGLGWMADQLRAPLFVRSIHAQVKKVSPERIEARQDVLEFLDDLVRNELQYRNKSGRFTLVPTKLPRFSSVHPQEYEVRVIRADSEHLLVSAFSEGSSGLEDQIFIDEQFRVQANFTLPEPSFEHLRSMALEYLRVMRAQSGQIRKQEPTLFRNYFKYLSLIDSSGQRIVRAVGVKFPVLGLELEWNGEANLSIIEGKEGKTLISSPVMSDLTIENLLHSAEKVRQFQAESVARNFSSVPEQGSPSSDQNIYSRPQKSALIIESLESLREPAVAKKR